MAKTIGDIYSNLIRETFIKSQLKKGKIPASEDIEKEVQNQRAKNSNFSQPLLTEDIYHIEEEEISSAKKMNETFDILKSDLSVAYQALLEQGNKLTDLYDSSYAKIKGFDKRIKSYENRINDLLFTSINTDRHEEVFYERFEMTDKIDLTNTTAELDLSTNSLGLKSTSGTALNLLRHGASLETNLGQQPNIVSSGDITGSSIRNLLDPTGSTWQYQVRTSEALSEIYLDLIINTPSSAQKINQIMLAPAGADLKSQVNAEIYYSDDKLNWLRPDGESRKRLVRETSFNFKGKKASHWRIRFTKRGSDGVSNGQYVYNFGLQNIRFIGKEFDKINRLDYSIFYSKPITPSKISEIKKATVQVCESKPVDTEIKYSVAPLSEAQLNNYDLASLNFYPVDVNDRDDLALVDFLRLSEVALQSDDIFLEETITYRYQADSNCAIDYLVASDINKAETKVMRNMGDNTKDDGLGDPIYVRGVSEGWSFKDGFYSTVVRVTVPGGIKINTGHTKITVNGTETSGEIVIPQGYSEISTSQDNWKEISLSEIIDEFSTNPDTLYPYNHKYLIEGISETLYDTDMTSDIGSGKTLLDIVDPDRVYLKQMSYWEGELREVELFNFKNSQETALDIFTYTVDNNGDTRVIVKTPKKNESLNKEKFSIITKTSSGEPVKGLIFKAFFETDDIEVTPVLTEYLLKLR